MIWFINKLKSQLLISLRASLVLFITIGCSENGHTKPYIIVNFRTSEMNIIIAYRALFICEFLKFVSFQLVK